MRFPFRASRQDRYKAHVARMTDFEVARAYVDLSAKVATLSSLVQEFARAFDTDNQRSFHYLPRYKDTEGGIDDLISDENSAQALLSKAQTWLDVLTEAVSIRHIETDNLTINQPGRPPFTGRRLDFSAYSNALPRT